MATEKSPGISFPTSTATGRQNSPPPHQLRQRPLTRAATLGNITLPPNRRRSSIFSENLSETRKSLRDSTEDLLLPRVGRRSDIHDEATHWHSFPLGLALFPALAGIFVQDGSAFITDISLLVLAAIFLNWALRTPWEWYHSAQAIRTSDPLSPPSFEVIEEEDGGDLTEEAIGSSGEIPPSSKSKESSRATPHKTGSDAEAAQRELRRHELVALLSCFVLPMIGAWGLHAIRSQLSRPSEGLISNYNLTVFILAAEIRPVSHVVKMIQARTLYLQRVINSDLSTEEESTVDSEKLLDVTRRLEELETHVADSVQSAAKDTAGSPEVTAAKVSAQASADLRKGIQPELDALNRAVRRYEKRMTISAIQTEARLQDLETRLKDVVVLAAAAQRNVENQPNNFIVILLNWICGAIVLPVQYGVYILTIPSKVANSVWRFVAARLPGSKKRKASKEPKQSRRSSSSRTRERRVRPET